MKIHIKNSAPVERIGLIWLPHPQPLFKATVLSVPPMPEMEMYVTVPPIKPHEFNRVVATKDVDRKHTIMWLPETIIDRVQAGDVVYYQKMANETDCLEHKQIVAYVRDGQLKPYANNVLLEPVELPTEKAGIYLANMKSVVRDTLEGATWSSVTHYDDRGRVAVVGSGLRGYQPECEIGDVVMVPPRMFLSRQIEGRNLVVMQYQYLKAIL
jgi:hypothetical protein